ncbi:MAG: hypothetical protein AB1631_07390 [Acidobacteriota bacterium]
MSVNFPPLPSHEHEIEILLQFLAGVIDGRSAIYVSAPITTGKRFSAWHANNGAGFDPSHPEYYEGHLREVIQPNREHARMVVRELRQSATEAIIDPTAVADFPEWTQDDYRYLWAGVIERYVKTLVFINGWQYSNGCAYEFLTAKRTGAMALDEKQHVITIEEGIKLIRSAIHEMRSYGVPTEFLEQMLEELAQMRYDAAEETCIGQKP